MKREIYDEDHEAFRSSVREFLEREVVPDLEQHAEEKALPARVLDRGGQAGLPRPGDPRGVRRRPEAGDYRFNAVLTEELARST